jgi:ABC-2 type transport system ATP-binding protein
MGQSPAVSAVAAIKAVGLRRTFGRVHALKDITFEIPAGVICGLIGPNGAGKTTLMRILAGLDEPDAGTRAMDGVDVGLDPHNARARFGYVPDYAALYDALSVADVARFFARAQGVPEAEVETNVRRALAATGMLDVGDRPAATLSKGMSQRACVACALVHDPSVILMDEPAGGLDPRARIELRELIKSLRDAGKTILISSHILGELSDMVDRVVIMELGVVKASGTVAEALAGALAVNQLRVRVEVLARQQEALALLRTQVGVMEALAAGTGMELLLQSPGAQQTEAQLCAALVGLLVREGFEVTAVIPQRPNLETLFLTVTRGDLQ